jgi:hypothetical protein
VDPLRLCFAPGELFALRWNDWASQDSEYLRIDEAFGKSGLDDPKTPRSDTFVYLPAEVQMLLREWQAWCGADRPDGFIFPSKRETPTRSDKGSKAKSPPKSRRKSGESAEISAQNRPPTRFGRF